MFTKPSFSILAGTILTVVVILGLIVAPDAWYADIEPADFAVARLSNTPGLVAGLKTDDQREFLQVIYWRSIATSPTADSLFAVLYRRGTPDARLYALVGLYYTKSSRYSTTLAIARRDTEYVEIYDPWHPIGPHRTILQLKNALNQQCIASWGELLMHGGQGRDIRACRL